MARRLTALLAVSEAALAAAVPAQAATTYTLIGHGWGHGIGLSQWGAYGYASHGWTYRQILAHYYTGTAIDQSPLGFTERVAMMDGRQTVHFGASAKMDGPPDRPLRRVGEDGRCRRGRRHGRQPARRVVPNRGGRDGRLRADLE